MSTRMTSQKSLSASRWAVVAPTFPAPITVIFFRLIAPLLPDPGLRTYLRLRSAHGRNQTLEEGHSFLHPLDKIWDFPGKNGRSSPNPCIPNTKGRGMSRGKPTQRQQPGGVHGRAHQVDAPADLLRLPDPPATEKALEPVPRAPP